MKKCSPDELYTNNKKDELIKNANLFSLTLAGLEAISVSAELAANVITEDDVNIKDATAIQKWLAGLDPGTDCIHDFIYSM